MDTVPYIASAGYSYQLDKESTSSCFKATAQEQKFTAPLTLSDKYRNAYKLQPSLRLIHPALAPSDPQAHIHQPAHGINSEKSSLTVAQVLKANNSPFTPSSASSSTTSADVPASYNCDDTKFVPDELHQFMQQHKESIYRTEHLAPLGRSYRRGHILPSSSDHVYGVHSKTSENAKQLIYAENSASYGPSSSSSPSKDPYLQDRRIGMNRLSREEEAQVTRPRRRAYNWSSPAIDPSTHAFGQMNVGLDRNGSNVAQALHPEQEEKETVIVNERIRNHHAAHRATIGASPLIRGEALLKLTQDPNFSFGKKSDSDTNTAKEMIAGYYSVEEQQPDSDLGRARPRVRTAPVDVIDKDRVYGITSMKQACNKPLMTSRADDNSSASSSSRAVLSPSPFATNGVNDEDFFLIRTPEYITDIFKRMGVEFKPQQMTNLCQMAVSLYGGLSLDSFRHAYNRMRLELRCQVCLALQCQHEECVHRACKHDGFEGLGNHRSFLTHARVVKPLNTPAKTNAL